MRTSWLLIGLLGLTTLIGCNGGGRSARTSAATAAATTSSSTGGTTSSATPTPPPATPPPATTPVVHGVVTRSVTTQAQAGLPPVTVSYDAFVPSGYDPAVATPLVFAANMGLGPWQALAEQEGVLVIDLRDHDRNGGWRFDYDVLVLDAVLADAVATWTVDAKRIYFHGFSAAAHWGYAVILSNANVFAGLGINAGSMSTAIQQGVWPSGVARKLAVAIRQGTSDTVVPPAGARDDRDRLLAAGHPVQLGEFAGGHTVAEADAREVWAFLKQFALP